MTTIIIATEQEGVARLYYSNGDGSLTQTAQVFVGDVDHVELAKIAAEMNDRFDWTSVKPKEPKQPKKPKEAPPTVTRKRAPSKNRMHRTRAERTATDNAVLAYIVDHPNSTVPEISEVVYGGRSQRDQSNVRAGIARLSKTHTFHTPERQHMSELLRYSVEVETAQFEPSTDPMNGAEPTDQR